MVPFYIKAFTLYHRRSLFCYSQITHRYYGLNIFGYILQPDYKSENENYKLKKNVENASNENASDIHGWTFKIALKTYRKNPLAKLHIITFPFNYNYIKKVSNYVHKNLKSQIITVCAFDVVL